MAENRRDIFPPHIFQRMLTPVDRSRCVSNLQVTRDRPWGNILYPVSQQPGSR